MRLAPNFMSKLQEKLAEKVEELRGKAINGVDGVTNTEAVSGSGCATEMVVVNDDGDNRNLGVVPEFAITLLEAEQRIQLLQEFVKRYMIPNQDYGLIPGCQKPTLFKSGGEKLCAIFAFAAKHIEITNRFENWDKGIFAYEALSTIVSKRTGHVEAQGIGAANSLERKFAKQDGFSIQNTIIKMAKKRSFIDAVLSATRSSGIFSQDIENTGAGEQKITPIKSGPSHREQSKQVNGKASEHQLQQIYSLARELKLSPGEAKQLLKLHFRINDSRLLTAVQADDLILLLEDAKKHKQ